MITRVRARIVGRVQGVGFRPTVYRYATQLGLGGFVRNAPHGVTVEVEGEDRSVGAFFSFLTRHPPKQSLIEGIETEVLQAKGYDRFEVHDSQVEGELAVLIPPDLATCDDCVLELFDPQDRRHRYPFINCTNCGPRFTIIREMPYDRDKTSMASFPMCEPCAREYHDASDRRFHAQPNACERCGPRLEWNEPQGGTSASNTEALARAVSALRAGRILAIKGIGGYHLACDATNLEAVARLRQRKHRPHKALAVMLRDLATVRKYCRLNVAEESELLRPARPIVLLYRKYSREEAAFWRDLNRYGDTPLSAHVELSPDLAPDTQTLGVFLPYSPLHHLLMQEFEALVMTSGNRSDEPIASDEVELQELLGPIADAALSHNRPILHKCDDSVVRVVGGQRLFLRRARGYVPQPILFAPDSPSLLAVGGELKNTFCLCRGGQAFLSQHVGDLKDYRTYRFFRSELESLQKLLGVTPVAVAHDLHPSYLSSRFARGLPLAHKIGVQHHHAHIASVLAEHEVHEPVLGVALDGTGYGPDGTIWGGEFFVADRARYERVAHFKPYPLPGGDKAIEQPWRMAVSVLQTEGMLESLASRESDHHLDTVQRMVTSRFNSPLTSSAGRLFDAVAAILGLCDAVSYEAQAAIKLEAVADPRVTGSYPFHLDCSRSPWVLDFGLTLHLLLDEQRRGANVRTLAAKFHNSVVAAITDVCLRLGSERRLDTVALSGGVFQNVLLWKRTTESLIRKGFRVLCNRLVPPNDGGLALGQAAVAAARLALLQSGRNADHQETHSVQDGGSSPPPDGGQKLCV